MTRSEKLSSAQADLLAKAYENPRGVATGPVPTVNAILRNGYGIERRRGRRHITFEIAPDGRQIAARRVVEIEDAKMAKRNGTTAIRHRWAQGAGLDDVCLLCEELAVAESRGVDYPVTPCRPTQAALDRLFVAIARDQASLEKAQARVLALEANVARMREPAIVRDPPLDGEGKRGTIETFQRFDREQVTIWPRYDSVDHLVVQGSLGGVTIGVVDNHVEERDNAVFLTIDELETVLCEGRRLFFSAYGRSMASNREEWLAQARRVMDKDMDFDQKTTSGSVVEISYANRAAIYSLDAIIEGQ